MRKKVLLGTNIVPILSHLNHRIGRFKTKTGNFSFYWHSISGKTVIMVTALRVSFCFFCDASIVLEILLIDYFTIFLVANLMMSSLIYLRNMKMSISLKWKKIFQKEKKCHSSVFWKAFQISRKKVSCPKHFKGLGIMTNPRERLLNKQ